MGLGSMASELNSMLYSWVTGGNLVSLNEEKRLKVKNNDEIGAELSEYHHNLLFA
jgi:hypothetical protein